MLTKHNAEHLITEYEPHRFTAFASDLSSVIDGFKNHRWPETFPTTLGNGQPFGIVLKRANEDGLEYVTYRQDAGCLILKVYND